MSQPTLVDALEAIPQALRQPLIAEFKHAIDAYRAGDWEKVGLKAGKFCEVAFNICGGYAQEHFPLQPEKPRNFSDACRQLERFSSEKGRSLCIQVPRVLADIYELRNNRAIAHVSSDISPNHMDAELFLRALKWVMGEFTRNFSSLALSDAQRVVEAVTARIFPIIWVDGERRRILDASKKATEKVLIILYHEGVPVNVKKLQKWVEYKNVTSFQKKIIGDLHKNSLVDFDKKAGTVQILPPGVQRVEESDMLDFKRNSGSSPLSRRNLKASSRRGL